MSRRLLAVPVALALLAAAAVPARAIQDSERPLPFAPEKCRALIDRGAPFALVGIGDPDIGDPDIAEACIVIIGGAPR